MKLQQDNIQKVGTKAGDIPLRDKVIPDPVLAVERETKKIRIK